MLMMNQVAVARSMRKSAGYSDLTDDVYAWLRGNLVFGEWEIELHSSGADVFFLRPEDAVQFKLAMSDHYVEQTIH
jgi:hypothetical protein